MVITNFAIMFKERVKQYGPRTCLRYKKDGRWIDLSWHEVDRIVREIGLGLISIGFKPGDRLALLSENRPEWCFMDLAVLSIGGSTATIYATNTPDQCSYIVKDSESKFVAVSNHHQLEKILKAKRKLPKVDKVIIFDPIKDITDQDQSVQTLSELRELGHFSEDRQAFDRRVQEVADDDILTLIYTSGTTGNPKGVVLTHQNVFSNVEAVLKSIMIEDGDSCLSFLPLSHSFERMAGQFTMLYAGIPIAYAESMDALLHNIGEIKPTVMVAVPRIYEKIHARILDQVESGGALKKKTFEWAMSIGRQVSRHKLSGIPLPALLDVQYKLAYRLVFAKLHELMGGRLRFFVSGGAPLNQEIGEFFHAAGIVILEGYGLTETSPVISANTLSSLRFGTVGKPVPGVEVRIADDGEILVRGPNVMREYYNNPEATKEVIDRDGWFYTGDIGQLDSEGFLKITDRKKDLIVTAGGKNIAPQQIENMMKMSRFIEQANVVGDRRKFLTAVIVPAFEEVRAWAESEGIKTKDNKALVAHPRVVALMQGEMDKINSQLARYESIKKFVLVDIEFTQENDMLTPSLKVKRKVVNAKFSKQIEQLYSQ